VTTVTNRDHCRSGRSHWSQRSSLNPIVGLTETEGRAVTESLCGTRCVIEVRARRRLDLTIHQQVWAMIAWSSTRRTWVVMDAALIRDGTMPDPATAHARA
jgi:hypothetical protein